MLHISEWKSLYYSFVYVRGGTFQMGATPQMINPFPNELPVHTVTVDGFQISNYEFTQALWEAVMGSNPSKVKGRNLPVTNVSWTDCQTFLSRLSELAQAKSADIGTFRINLWQCGIRVRAIIAPFYHIACHIVESEFVGLLLAYGPDPIGIARVPPHSINITATTISKTLACRVLTSR